MQLRKLRDARSEWVPGFERTSRVFDGFRPIVERLSSHADWPSIEALSDVVRAEAEARRASAPRMVLQGPRKRGPRDRASLYDAQIVERREVPTRERHWHDTMNALVWAAFPKAKQALHERQYRALCAALDERFDAIPGARSKEHDAIAMLDEGGVLILAEREVAVAIERALQQLDPRPLEAAVRARQAALWTFGHGILESVLLAQTLPRTQSFACVVPCDNVPGDQQVAREFADEVAARALASGDAPTRSRPLPSLMLSEAWLEELNSLSAHEACVEPGH